MLIGFSIRTLIRSAREIGTDSRVRGVQSRSEPQIFGNCSQIFSHYRIKGRRDPSSVSLDKGESALSPLPSNSPAGHLLRVNFYLNSCWSAPTTIGAARSEKTTSWRGRKDRKGRKNELFPCVETYLLLRDETMSPRPERVEPISRIVSVCLPFTHFFDISLAWDSLLFRDFKLLSKFFKL
jgi:hypothetical protein